MPLLRRFASWAYYFESSAMMTIIILGICWKRWPRTSEAIGAGTRQNGRCPGQVERTFADQVLATWWWCAGERVWIVMEGSASIDECTSAKACQRRNPGYRGRGLINQYGSFTRATRVGMRRFCLRRASGEEAQAPRPRSSAWRTGFPVSLCRRLSSSPCLLLGPYRGPALSALMHMAQFGVLPLRPVPCHYDHGGTRGAVGI